MTRLQRSLPTIDSLRRKADDRTFIVLAILLAFPVALMLLLPPSRASPLLPAFVTALFGILIDALPFLIGGSLVSVIIHEFVPASFFKRLLNRSGVAGVLIASVSGAFLPLCECGIVPLVRGLLRSGVRPAVALTVLFALPLCNPIVVASTFYAFSSRPIVAWERLIFGWLSVVVIGLLCLAFEKWFVKRILIAPAADMETAHVHGHADSNRGELEKRRGAVAIDLLPKLQPKPRGLFRIVTVFEHALEELYSTGRFLVAGALIAALFQIFVRVPVITGGDPSLWGLQVLLIVAAAFVMSLCSASDAFVARGMLSGVGHSVVLAFLLAGPLLQLRTLLAMVTVFHKRALLALSVIVVAVVFATALVARLIFGV